MSVPTPDLARQGGKGANLIRLAGGGLPVPPFVVLETDEYEAFVDSAGLRPVIADALRSDPAAASAAIRAAFAAASFADGQRERLLQRLAPLATPEGDLRVPVAVRSSATAEDLPGFSFAGQQDTFLEVSSLEAALERIVACWSSLWTERAITYRSRNAFGHDTVSLAVVVQEMVDADASGVLFTANPGTGRRDESVVEATHGLGESLVSGQVTPDSFVLETATGAIRSQQVSGAKASMSPSQLRDLGALGRRIVHLYHEPMDIEWARVGDTLFVLQARPVTSLYPLPAPNPVPHDAPEVWFSFGAFQGVLEPITPLGQDMIRMAFSGAARVFGRRLDWHTNRIIEPAGERLWIRVDSLLRIRASRALLQEFLPMVEPSAAQILAQIADEPGLRPTRATPPATLAAALASVVSRLAPRIRGALTRPELTRRSLDLAVDGLVAGVAAEVRRAADLPTPQARLSARVDAMEQAGRQMLSELLPVFAPVMGPTMVQLRRLREAAARTGRPDSDALAMAVLRALPGNVTTEMDLSLADVAATIRSDANSWGWVAETPASDLARQFASGGLPRVAQGAIGEFMDAYGMRGVAEIDLGARRWRDDPAPVMHTIKAYLAMPPEASPRAVHLAGQHEAGRSIRTLMDASTPVHAQKIKRLAQSIRALAGARETPKFALIRCFGHLREGLDASGRELVEQGRLASAADIAFLRADELRRAFASDWREVVAVRRARWDAEGRRVQVPRVIMEDGRTFYEGIASEPGEVRGAGVSPGVAEGPVRVVRDPRTTQLVPGEILVCQGTDPAWTPLFLTAGGLITEVGGLMTHGSVVAREYGIPAVVGVHQATTRLVDGQRVRIDGASGAIKLL
ncbi:MAG: PEP/pyruvate-binding domain-containing protein [Actinomycetes bacterium]